MVGLGGDTTLFVLSAMPIRTLMVFEVDYHSSFAPDMELKDIMERDPELSRELRRVPRTFLRSGGGVGRRLFV